MKKRKWILMVLCGVLTGVVTLTSCTGKEKQEKSESDSEEAAKAGEEDTEQKTELVNLRNYTTLEVVTDNTQFTPVTQDQSYQAETDVNYFISRGLNVSCFSADTGTAVYMSIMMGEKRPLFVFQKETESAEIACSKPGCEHNISVKGDCQANLYMLNASLSGMQYYDGVFYFALSDRGAAILYKTSSDHEIKSQYAMLVGEKEYGKCDSWLIHRGYLYFSVENDGIYKMSVNNPSDKEKLVNMSGDEISSGKLLAEGSYIYFKIEGSYASAFARYNIESNQIEQFMNIGKVENDFIVHDQKIYYTGYLEENQECVVYRYDAAAGTNEIFLRGEDRENFDTSFGLINADFDYIYIQRKVAKKGDYSAEDETNTYTYFAYTWDGAVAGEIVKPQSSSGTKLLEAFQEVHEEAAVLICSDNDRIYYIGQQSDRQVGEDRVTQYLIEGTKKIVISYIDKSEISLEASAPLHIAGEIYD